MVELQEVESIVRLWSPGVWKRLGPRGLDLFLNEWLIKSWRKVSVVKSTVTLAEDQSLVPSTYMAAHNSL